MIAKSVLSIAALYLLAVASAAAATVSLSLDESLIAANLGETVAFSGTAVNTGPAPAYLNSTSFVFPGVLDDTSFFLNFPPVLPAGGSASGTLFTTVLSVPALPGLHLGSFSILGGDTPAASDVLATVDFGVRIVPEPGTLFSLAAGLLLIAWRRH
jgi:hypothetical protein